MAVTGMLRGCEVVVVRECEGYDPRGEGHESEGLRYI